jgi:hypothetical protein
MGNHNIKILTITQVVSCQNQKLAEYAGKTAAVPVVAAIFFEVKGRNKKDRIYNR